MKSNDEMYEQWLELRRRERPGPGLTNRTMAGVTRADVRRATSLLVLVLMWMDRSRARRLAACMGSLLVGSTPFIYLAYISQTFTY